MADQYSTVIRSSNYEASPAAHLMFQKLERIGTLITNVYELFAGWQWFNSLEPQQTFTCFSFAFLARRLCLSNLRSTMQHLIAQSQNFASLRVHRQAVLRDIAAMFPVADCPKPESEACVVKSISVAS
jgi:hypothetical protein